MKDQKRVSRAFGKSSKKTKGQKSKIKFSLRLGLTVSSLLGLLLVVNFLWQVGRKPLEIASLLISSGSKTPKQTWQAYKDYFIEHSTSIMTPDFLAALVQQESSGNPLGTPQWNLNLKKSFSNMYAPASTSVGLMQFTEGTFDLASRFCIHKGQVKSVGPWYQLDSCWFNGLYTRVLPSHSIEATSAYLHRATVRMTNRFNLKLTQKSLQAVAASIHLCGEGHVEKELRQRRLSGLKNCGSHRLSRYIKSVQKYQKIFLSENP